MDNRYLNYCTQDSPFYENIDTPKYWEEYSVAAPPDWVCVKSGDWINWGPLDFHEKLQGWKIHISTVIEDAEKVLKDVSEYLISKNTIFKHIGTRQELINRNSKSADRSSSGKFITIYPNNNESFDEIVKDLTVILKGKKGPYILSDIRLGNVPIYARYGGFLTLNMLDKFGNKIPAVVDKNNNLIPDERNPLYMSPSESIERPYSVRIAEKKLYEQKDSNYLDNYVNIRAISFSNSGGVYRANRPDMSKESVILKEARPYAGLDRLNRNAFERLKNEWNNLSILKDTGIAPAPNKYFKAWEHEYIEMENVGSKSLGERAIEIFPFSRKQSVMDFTDEITFYLDQLINIVNITHDYGIVIGDVHPHNFIISKTGKIKIIDLEDDRPLDSIQPGGFNAFGYQPPNNITAEAQDWWSLSRVMSSIFHIARPIEIISPEYWDWSLNWINNNFGSDVVSRIKNVEEKIGDYSGNLQFHLRSDFNINPVSEKLTPAKISTKKFRDVVIDSLDYHSSNFGTLYRPYPGDIESLKNNLSSLISPMHGALGVEAMKYENDKNINSNIVDTILSTVKISNSDNCGLFYGLAGTALFMNKLCDRDILEKIVNNVYKQAMFTRRLDLASGVSGAVHCCSIFTQTFNNDELYLKTEVLLNRISSVMDNGELKKYVVGSGLFSGLTGIAIAYISAYLLYRDEEYIERAVDLINKEIQNTVVLPGDRMYILNEQFGKALPYINGGSAGILVAISILLKTGVIDSDLFRQSIPKLIESCRSNVYAFAGLLNGRIGIISALLAMKDSGFSLEDNVIEQHINELNQHLVCNNDRYLLIGDQYLRTSLDLGTGLCGVISLSMQLEKGGIPWFPGYNFFEI